MITSVIGQSLRVVIEQFAIVLVGIAIIILIVLNADISNYIPFFGASRNIGTRLSVISFICHNISSSPRDK